MGSLATEKPAALALPQAERVFASIWARAAAEVVGFAPPVGEAAGAVVAKRGVDRLVVVVGARPCVHAVGQEDDDLLVVGCLVGLGVSDGAFGEIVRQPHIKPSRRLVLPFAAMALTEAWSAVVSAVSRSSGLALQL